MADRTFGVRKPTFGSVAEFKRARLREPRVNSKGEKDTPAMVVSSGALSVTVGLAAVSFASVSMKRVIREKAIINQMWKLKTTVASLMGMADPLPAQVLLRGRLGATGPPVRALTSNVQQLQPLLGQIDQPYNELIAIGQKFKEEHMRDQKSGLKNMVDKSSAGALSEVEELAKLSPDEALEPEDYHRTTGLQSGDLLVTDLLVTRLGCEARKKVKKDKNGRREVSITRKPRRARFNVKHVRQVADGLYIRGLAGRTAQLQLPEYDIGSRAAPSLFLTLPDAMAEFKGYFSGIMPMVTILNSDQPFTHLSKFIFIDKQSVTDDGSFQASSTRTSALETSRAFKRPPVHETSALDELGRLSPNGWHWDGHGYYDNNPGSWSKWVGKEVLDYEDFKQRLPEAARLNALGQEATEVSPSEMEANRDDDNCFRFAELGISASDVTVLGSPKREEDGSITIGPPPVTSSHIKERFEFRILRGHTIENLIKHSQGSLQVYFGLACMGLFTVFAGEEMIRDCLVVSYVL